MLSVYPNPAREEITVQLNNEWMAQKSVLSIYNTQGTLVYSKNYEKILQPEIKIDIRSMAAGGYFISIENDKMKSVGSFIKPE